MLLTVPVTNSEPVSDLPQGNFVLFGAGDNNQRSAQQLQVHNDDVNGTDVKPFFNMISGSTNNIKAVVHMHIETDSTRNCILP